MTSVISHYLRNKTATAQWPLQGEHYFDGISEAVVIPALAESGCLFDTLLDLHASSLYALQKTMIIVVANNRRDTPAADIADNRVTLQILGDFYEQKILSPLRLCWVDAASPGAELPDGEGVGLARKIGADHALKILAEQGGSTSPIVHLDADSPPSPGYLDALLSFYEERPRWAAWSGYQHPTDLLDSRYRNRVVAYENYMRYHELALRYAGSPYAYPALGSIMSSTAVAYASAGGMNRRCAGEDFYFMQQLRKTGSMEPIPHTMVYPASRVSLRTPYGTGQVIANKAGDNEQAYGFLFHPECYVVLKHWLELAADEIMLPAAALLDTAGAINKELKSFLKTKRFQTHWERISANHPTPQARLHQFHVWFDGLRTIQLIHHLRDTTFPNVPAEDAISTLFTWYGHYQTSSDPLLLLREMRRLCR